MGPINNGGIGTHCYYLARFLKRDLGHEVTILFTAPVTEETLRPWRKRYSKEWGIHLVSLNEISGGPRITQSPPYPMLRRSLQVYDWLKDQDFDFCHFEDWHPEGFVAIQAKRTGQAFANTQLILVMHGNPEWSREGTLAYEDNWTAGLAHEYMARYCAEHADLLVSPSQYMLDWAQARHWTPPSNRCMIPLLFEQPFEPSPKPFAREHLIFFGRLETRKGLVVFTKALRALAPSLRNRPRPLQVTFLGRDGFVGKQRATDYLSEAMRPLHTICDWSIISNLGQPDALRFLADHGDALVVIPSLSDNSPFTVIECLQLRLNMIASRVGGIPELVDSPECLFEPTPAALKEKLLACLHNGTPDIRARYSTDAAREAWSRVHETGAFPTCPPKSYGTPKVSVCVPHHNYGKFLPLALQSLAEQTYGNREVIIVDDGSTDPVSLETFRSLQREFPQPSWRFFEKPNGFSGQTRNFAARESTGEYLVFVDSDNVTAPNMIERMVRGMEVSGVDCLSCHNFAFRSDDQRKSERWENRYAPIGPCLEVAMYENALGDVNFIIRREVFEELGGFHEQRDIGLEDWDFLLRLVESGFTLDVIPEVLFYYRQAHTSESVTGVVSQYASHQRLLRTVTDRMPDWQRRFLRNAVGTFWTNSIVPRTGEPLTDLPVSSDDSEALRRELVRVQARLDRLKATPIYRIGRWWYYTKQRFKKQPPAP